MPIYEYECTACHQMHEAIQKFSDPELTECPACGGCLQKMMSLNAFHLKGGGWYVTDYKGKNASTSGDAGGGDKTPASDKAAKTEASPKPEAAKKD